MYRNFSPDQFVVDCKMGKQAKKQVMVSSRHGSRTHHHCLGSAILYSSLQTKESDCNNFGEMKNRREREKRKMSACHQNLLKFFFPPNLIFSATEKEKRDFCLKSKNKYDMSKKERCDFGSKVLSV